MGRPASRHRLLTSGAALVSLAAFAGSGRGDDGPPARLRDTGLYADWDAKRVDPRNLPYAPQYPLWSDGAQKTRFLRLPEGTWVDASSPDEWRFPVGTRLFKEFRFAGRRVETRLIERTPTGWRYATYLWSEDESDAVLAPPRGLLQSVAIRDGVRHAIPSTIDCRTCHESGLGPVLGVSALQLSPDRDPGAPHAEPVPPGGVDLRDLVARGLVRDGPDPSAAPGIDAPSARTRAVLGYLHANCATCHNANGPLASLDLALESRAAPPTTVARTVGSTPRMDPLQSLLGRPSRFRLDGFAGERVRPGRPDESVLLARMASRHPVVQMPPLGSRIVDEDAVRLVRRWIAEDLVSTSKGGER